MLGFVQLGFPGSLTTDLDLAAFVVVSTAEGIASNASDELFWDRLAKEISSLLNLYLTGEE